MCTNSEESMSAAEANGYKFEALPDELRWDYAIAASFDDEGLVESVVWGRSDGATDESDPDSWNLGVPPRTWVQQKYFDEVAAG